SPPARRLPGRRLVGRIERSGGLQWGDGTGNVPLVERGKAGGPGPLRPYRIGSGGTRSGARRRRGAGGGRRPGRARRTGRRCRRGGPSRCSPGRLTGDLNDLSGRQRGRIVEAVVTGELVRLEPVAEEALRQRTHRVAGGDGVGVAG